MNANKGKADFLDVDQPNNNNGCSSSSLCFPCIKDCNCECHNRTDLDFLPSGYRFDPTDQELIKDYLLKEINNQILPKNKIRKVDFGDLHPKAIVEEHAQAGEAEWYFFSTRQRILTNDKRPRRSAGNGYWKASTAIKDINENGSKLGGRRSLVYYEGMYPKGTKTEWLMQEFVAEGCERERQGFLDMKLDIILCKVYLNKKGAKDLQVKETVSGLVSYQGTNSASFQIENNFVQNSRYATPCFSPLPVASNDQQSISRTGMQSSSGFPMKTLAQNLNAGTLQGKDGLAINSYSGYSGKMLDGQQFAFTVTPPDYHLNPQNPNAGMLQGKDGLAINNYSGYTGKMLDGQQYVTPPDYHLNPLNPNAGMLQGKDGLAINSYSGYTGKMLDGQQYGMECATGFPMNTLAQNPNDEMLQGMDEFNSDPGYMGNLLSDDDALQFDKSTDYGFNPLRLPLVSDYQQFTSTSEQDI